MQLACDWTVLFSSMGHAVQSRCLLKSKYDIEMLTMTLPDVKEIFAIEAWHQFLWRTLRERFIPRSRYTGNSAYQPVNGQHRRNKPGRYMQLKGKFRLVTINICTLTYRKANRKASQPTGSLCIFVVRFIWIIVDTWEIFYLIKSIVDDFLLLHFRGFYFSKMQLCDRCYKTYKNTIIVQVSFH